MLEHIRGVQVIEGVKGSGDVLPQLAPKLLHLTGPELMGDGADHVRQHVLASAGAVVLNDQDLSQTRTGFDARSARVLTAAARPVGDPLSEAVCWNGFWLLVTVGELPAARFTDMACRRPQAGGLPEVGVETLLSRAVEAADAWAPRRQRAG